MTTELTALAWTLALALVQIFLPVGLRNGETGLAYNMGPRDEAPPKPPGVVTARLQRAQKNLFETLPIFAGVVLIASAANIHSTATVWGAWGYLAARVIYVPLYAFGVPGLRSLAFLVSVVAILAILVAVLRPV